jgi:hypothetical protein
MSELNAYLSNTTSFPKVWNAQRSDLIYRELRASKSEIEKYLADLISNGYTIVDAPASGDLDLTSETNANRKYVVVWKTNDPTGTVNIDLTSSMTDSSGSILGNGKVVILGCKLNTYNQVTNSYLSLDLQFDKNEDYSDDLELRYMSVDFTFSGILGTADKISFNNIETTSGFEHFGDITMDYCNIDINGGAGLLINIPVSRDFEITNSYFYISESIGYCAFGWYGAYTGKFTNCVFETNSGASGYFGFAGFGYGGAFTLNFENTIFINSLIEIKDEASTSDKSIIYISNSGYTNGSANNYVFKQGYPDRQQFLSSDSTNWALDYTEVNTSGNYSDDLQALITPEFEYTQVPGNDWNRRYYNLNFRSNYQFLDEFKTMFAPETSVLVWWRQDLETDSTFGLKVSGSEKKIKNLLLYDNDGTTLTDYRNNENFFILAKDASNNYVVVAWFMGLIYPTVFTDFWDGTTYTVEKVFNLLEPPAQSAARVGMHDFKNDSRIEDGPIDATVRMFDLTSYYVDRRV